MSSLGIDIGGANLKVASEEGWEIIYFPIWKNLELLETKLKGIAEKYKVSKVGVVITAELADVFRNKEEGVKCIAEVCKKVFRHVYFLNINGEIKENIDNPRAFAASNWLASVKLLLKDGYRNFLFVDMGSTTTDLIPVTEKIEAQKTDYERLKAGDLVYFGVLRTPVFYILKEFNGAPLCPEYFAIMADVFRVTEDINSEDYSCETPDGKGKDVESCLRRLARTICSDLEELGYENVCELANIAKHKMIETLANEIRKKIEKYNLDIVLACGVGEFIIEEACARANVRVSKLSEIYGEYSKLFPAYAMLRLIEKH